MPNTWTRFPKSTWPLQRATRSVLTLVLSLLCAGCATRRVIVIPADKEVIRLPAAEAYTPAIPGWFVPDARMQEILHQLHDKAGSQ